MVFQADKFDSLTIPTYKHRHIQFQWLMNPIIQIILFILKFTLKRIHILDDSVISLELTVDNSLNHLAV